MESKCRALSAIHPPEEVRIGIDHLGKRRPGDRRYGGMLVGMLERGDCRAALNRELERDGKRRRARRASHAWDFFKRLRKTCPPELRSQYESMIDVIMGVWPNPKLLAESEVLTDEELSAEAPDPALLDRLYRVATAGRAADGGPPEAAASPAPPPAAVRPPGGMGV
ncbi:MAG: hypothetical protein AB7O77_10895 [Phycisphaerales bacterium]